MLTKEQIEEIKNRPRCALLTSTLLLQADKDIKSLIAHIEELTQKAYCEHNWQYLYETGFKCKNCGKTKESIRK